MVESVPAGPEPMQATEGTPTAPRNALASDPVAFTITLLVSSDVDFQTVAAITEAQADLFMAAVEEETGVDVVDKLIWDPLHPDDDGYGDCRCSGVPGWHCPSEESEHWAKWQALDAECGHCGWQPQFDELATKITEASGLTT